MAIKLQVPVDASCLRDQIYIAQRSCRHLPATPSQCIEVSYGIQPAAYQRVFRKSLYLLRLGTNRAENPGPNMTPDGEISRGAARFLIFSGTPETSGLPVSKPPLNEGV
jgi:hypothetical protein